MRKILKQIAVTIALAGAFGLAGSLSAAAQEVITIGATAPITGSFSSIYAVQGKLWEAWAQAQNEGGGIYVKSLGKKLSVKFIFYDDQSDPKTSVKFYERLITEDKVNFLLAPPGSPIAFAASTVAERYKVPMLMGAATDPQIFARGFKYIQGVMVPASDWSHEFFELVRTQKKVHRVALLVEDSLYSRGVASGIRKYVAAEGISLVFDQTAPPDNQDFTAIITQIKDTNPDLVYVATFPPFFIKFAKQAAELGLNPPAYHCATCSAISVRNALGPIAQDITGEVVWVPGMKLGDYKLLERTLQISSIDPVQWTFAVISIPVLEVLRAGIEEAGTLDREAVFHAIKSNTVDTVIGRFKASPDGQGTLHPLPMQWQNGKAVVIWPPEAKTGEYQYPRKP